MEDDLNIMKMEGNLNFFENGRRPQFFENGRLPSFYNCFVQKRMEDDLKKYYNIYIYPTAQHSIYFQATRPTKQTKVKWHNL